MVDDATMTDAVFRRTAAGSAEAIRGKADLPEGARRLLLRVTGLTPLSALTAHVDDSTLEHVGALLAWGLVEPVDDSAQ